MFPIPSNALRFLSLYCPHDHLGMLLPISPPIFPLYSSVASGCLLCAINHSIPTRSTTYNKVCPTPESKHFLRSSLLLWKQFRVNIKRSGSRNQHVHPNNIFVPFKTLWRSTCSLWKTFIFLKFISSCIWMSKKIYYTPESN